MWKIRLIRDLPGLNLKTGDTIECGESRARAYEKKGIAIIETYGSSDEKPEKDMEKKSVDKSNIKDRMLRSSGVKKKSSKSKKRGR